MHRISRWVCGLGASVVFATGAVTQDALPGGSTNNGTGLKPGEVLNQSTWKAAEGLLPPEVLRHYETGGYINTAIADWPDGIFKFDPEFLAATESNAGKYK